MPAFGSGLTVTANVALAEPHEFEVVYEITVEPAATPETTPVPLIVAIAVLSVLQPPPALASVSTTEEPWHTEDVPEIAPAEGNGITATVTVAEL